MKPLIVLCFLVVLINTNAQTYQLLSPDNTIKTIIHTAPQLSWELLVDNRPILSPSLINLDFANTPATTFAVKRTQTRTVHETIVAQVPVSRKNIPDHYNELTITFKNNIAVIFRAYNDGVAYRLATTFKDSVTVINETAQFNFGSSAVAYAPLVVKRPGQDVYHTSFEELYAHKPVDSFTNAQYMFTPVLAEANNIKVAITESDLDDYPGMFLQGTGTNSFSATFAPYPLEEKVAEGDYPQKIVTKRAGYIARTNGTRHFPWRALLVAKKDKELPANDLVYRLAEPSVVRDASWIHPGKCTDEWIIDVNLFNVPFESGINTASYKYYIDFAKQFGFDRIMMDAGWSNTKDLFSINPNINMDTIAAYARSKGIKLSMWTLAMTLDRQLDSALKQFQRWGVDFIMTDFIDRDDQPAVNFHKRIAQACADAKIMIMFHGTYPPKGINRTYPNCITKEAILGSEYNAWSDKPSATHNLTIPFTRMLAGPLDYEPGLLDNATPQQFRPIWGKVMSQTTRCQQLAMFVVYDNPLQIFSGNPSQGLTEPAFMQLLGSLPTTWDTTVIADAAIAKYIVTARRHGNNWFIAGMTDSTARDLQLDLSFLEAGKYNATICKDGINAHRNAMDYVIEETTLVANDALQIHLAPGGGFLVRLRKE
ncbi:glycoside hydrolase family 97 protein [Panacibacter sp. DH6]|uniref:Glycoside hydrolase family 97 protein n=1 Tax=Panacibacter microcysteis TaxID=2793269 RepID=A0A931E7W2_9BACT|nr:glycoside hydrolase family 97 protein [Panacibacter microcysteis]MBG9376895.1 glycoside hydrolase family 97 protein [Panacibacter microcysteis]